VGDRNAVALEVDGRDLHRAAAGTESPFEGRIAAGYHTPMADLKGAAGPGHAQGGNRVG
jgi:hypothetical protein